MNVCVEDYDSSSSSSYNIYTCTQDSSTGDVIVSRTSYTDAACTTGASAKTPQTYSNTCMSGVSAICDDANDIDSTASSLSDGLFLAGYSTSSQCLGGDNANVVGYGGGFGFIEGLFYGKESINIYSNFAECTGTLQLSLPYSTIFPTQCQALHDDDQPEIDDDGAVHATFTESDDDDVCMCFHVDSKINYKGVEYTYEELKAGKEPECTVPHSPSSKGVIITTSCDKTVRVTDTHLLATTKGFQLAYSLKVGDVLFGDYGNENENEKCTVISVEKEKTTKQYFGLNCVHSEVLASGLRASTFGDFHTLPSWYMTYVGSVLGADTASALGDYVAEWYYQK